MAESTAGKAAARAGDKTLPIDVYPPCMRIEVQYDVIIVEFTDGTWAKILVEHDEEYPMDAIAAFCKRHGWEASQVVEGWWNMQTTLRV